MHTHAEIEFMEHIKFIILPLLLFTISTNVLSQSSAEADSLLNEIDKAKGEKRLELIYQYSLLYEEDKKLLEIANWLEKEAVDEDNDIYKANSYSLKVRFFLFESNLDSVLYYSNKIDALSKKDEQIEDSRFLVHYYIATMYISKGYYDLAIYELNELLNSREKNDRYEAIAYQCLGFAYFASKRIDLAEINYRKSLEIMEQESEISSNTYPIYYGLIGVLIQLEQYEEALDICQRVESMIKENTEKLPQSSLDLFLYRFYVQHVHIYVALEDAPNAKKYLDMVEELPLDGIHDIFLSEKKAVYAYYYSQGKDYSRALNYVQSALEQLKESDFGTSFIEELTALKIETLHKLQRYDEAFFEQQKFLNYKDSIYQKNVPLQLAQLSMNYELKKAQLEQQNHKTQLSKSRLINLGLVFIICFGGFLFYMSRRNMKTLKTKNKVLYKQSLDVKKYIDFIKEQRQERTKETEDSERKTSLFEQLDAYMQESEIYKDSDVTREVVAKALNTNRQYLADAIKAEINMTFMDYVNEYRLNFARNQLIIDESVPVNNIIQEAGFISNATFYRLFKEKFGMTPSELRQAKNELETEIIK